VASSAGLIGFGTSASDVFISPGPVINLTGLPATLINFAFSAPRDGIIRSIAGYFSNVSPLVLTGVTTLHVQIWQAVVPSMTPNLFVPTTAEVVIDISAAISSLGGNANGITTGLNVPVVQENRYVLVTMVTSTSLASTVIINGYISAGITIE